MGEPSEPSAHPDNITAATQTPATGPASVTRPAPSPAQPAAPAAGGLGRQPSGSFGKATLGGLGRQPSGSFDKAALGGLGRQPSGSFDKAALGGGGGGLRRQPSGAYDAATASKTDKGFFGGAPAATPAASVPLQRQNSQPGLVPPPTTIPVGAAPASPYMKTEEVPPSGTSKLLLQIIIPVSFHL